MHETVRQTSLPETRHHPVSDLQEVLVHEKVERDGDADRIAVDFTIGGIDPESAHVMLGPWHPFAQSPVIKDNDIGLPVKITDVIKPRTTIPGIEPNGGGECHTDCRVAYNFAIFETEKQKKILVGVMPDFVSTNRIFIRKGDGHSMRVHLENATPGVFRKGKRELRYIVVEGDRYIDVLNEYSKKIDDYNPVKTRSRLDGAALACTWDWAGKYVSEDAVVKEIEAIKVLHEELKRDPEYKPSYKIDGLILDDGWQFGHEYNAQNVNTNKFPHGLRPIIEAIQSAGMEAGIWMAPFFKSETSPLLRDHPDYFLRDENGSFVRYKVRQSIHEDDRHGRWAYSEYPMIMDISVPEVREHIMTDIKSHYDMGVRLFKLDFLSAVFSHPLKNRDKTTVEYYRDFFGNVRNVFPEAKFIGCTLPLTESLGLFDAMRVSNDSIIPSKGFGTKHVWGRIISLLSLTDIAKKSNGLMYKDMVLKSALRSTMLGKNSCAAVDGVHWDDKENPIDASVFANANELIRMINTKDSQVVHFIGGSVSHLDNRERAVFVSLLKSMQEKEAKRLMEIDELQQIVGEFYKPPWLVYALGSTT